MRSLRFVLNFVKTDKKEAMHDNDREAFSLLNPKMKVQNDAHDARVIDSGCQLREMDGVTSCAAIHLIGTKTSLCLSRC